MNLYPYPLEERINLKNLKRRFLKLFTKRVLELKGISKTSVL